MFFNVFDRFSCAHFPLQLSQLRIHDRLDVLKALPSTKNEVRLHSNHSFTASILIRIDFCRIFVATLVHAIFVLLGEGSPIAPRSSRRLSLDKC